MVHCRLLILIHVEEYSERYDTIAIYTVGIIQCETKEDFRHRYLELDNTCIWYYKA